MIAVENKIQEIVNNHKSGSSTGITSVCSSNFYVIKAAIVNAKKNNRPVLIESTSNQVDQYGGYMGITPSQFIELVFKIADSLNFPREGVILGGDHLGPNRWQNEKSDSAMKKAKDQISAYVSAGYNKIHLDATMNCADDGYQDNPLSPSVIAERTALLCKAAEEAFEKSNNWN
jgi:D-tagatose-1,6-bisphosphate aldolase subunit GatZ/KbaZ